MYCWVDERVVLGHADLGGMFGSWALEDAKRPLSRLALMMLLNVSKSKTDFEGV